MYPKELDENGFIKKKCLFCVPGSYCPETTEILINLYDMHGENFEKGNLKNGRSG